MKFLLQNKARKHRVTDDFIDCYLDIRVVYIETFCNFILCCMYCNSTFKKYSCSGNDHGVVWCCFLFCLDCQQ